MPLPYSGKLRSFVSHTDDLCDEIICRLLDRRASLFFAAHSWPYSLRRFVSLLKEGDRKQILIPFNSTNTRTLIFLFGLLLMKHLLVDSLKSLEAEISNEEL